jgi:hypothetical protein
VELVNIRKDDLIKILWSFHYELNSSQIIFLDVKEKQVFAWNWLKESFI